MPDANDASSNMAAQDPRPAVDLRSLDFLSPIDDNLLCSVCHCAFIRPVMTKCGHIFCKECFESATQERKGTCPFCRTPINQTDTQAAPRPLVNMVDDLKVKCPHAKAGCTLEATRSSVQVHIDKYCEYLEVDCGIDGCDSKTLKKDLGLGCVHREVECPDCQDLVIGKELNDHRRNVCSERYTHCPLCLNELLVCDTVDHNNICAETILVCPGSTTGCPAKLVRKSMPSHAESCPFARLSPLIDSHSSRIRTLETENAILRRKLEAFTSPTLAPMMPNNLPPLNDPGDPSSSDNHQLSTATTNDESQSIELQTHLITSYESLRSDIDRLSVSMSDLDARQSVLVMNESLRVKDDFAHLNAVVGSMRVQLHWLMSNRLQNQQRQQQVTRSPASATAVAVAGSSTAANTGATGSNTRSTTAPGPNDMAAGPRRLSETSRQETKL